jgi:hypothetical protein
VAVSDGANGDNPDPGIRLVLEEIRDLRLEMRTDRQQDWEERRQTETERRRADEEWRQERRQSDERFAHREAATQTVLENIHTVGLAIVRNLTRQTRVLEQHGRILERIDRKLDPRWNGRRGRGNGRAE